MTYPKEKLVGTIFIIAATQFLLCLSISEALYPGYSLASNYISDLGIGPSAIIFNISIFVLGLIILFGTYLQMRNPEFKTLNILLVIMAVGTMGVGIFTKAFTLIHGATASVAFFFAALSAIASAKATKKPLSHISVVLGLLTLIALALYSLGIVTSGALTSSEALDSSFYLGLGPGGMERLVVYPALMWLAAFGGHLVTKQET